MKSKIIFLVFVVILLIGCTQNDINVTEQKKKENADMKFNYEDSFKVIKDALTKDENNDMDKQTESILRTLERSGIKGAVSATIITDDKLVEDGVFSNALKIVCEDQKVFLVYFNTNYRVEGIKDMETNEYVYGVVE